jgi:hypothetical protein
MRPKARYFLDTHAATLGLPLVTLDPKISSFARTLGVRIVW